uniref:THAP-type domain-containing protein n=1 Tax=Ixodes ricinus TaxID=34613 RepID=A0A131XNE0_IXORI
MGGCCALGCPNRSSARVRLFKLPKSPRRRKLWLARIGRGAGWNPSAWTYVCQDHFEPSQYQTRRFDGWRKLKATAVPTIFSESRSQVSACGKNSTFIPVNLH